MMFAVLESSKGGHARPDCDWIVELVHHLFVFLRPDARRQRKFDLANSWNPRVKFFDLQPLHLISNAWTIIGTMLFAAPGP